MWLEASADHRIWHTASTQEMLAVCSVRALQVTNTWKQSFTWISQRENARWDPRCFRPHLHSDPTSIPLITGGSRALLESLHTCQASRPFHLLFHLPGIFYSQKSSWLAPSLHCDVYSHLIYWRELLLSKQSGMAPPLLQSLSIPLPCVLCLLTSTCILCICSLTYLLPSSPARM